MKTLLILWLPATLLGACTTADQPMPLVFGRTQSIGIGVQGSAADQGASITVGYNDRNIAVVPTTSIKGEAIRSVAPETSTGSGQFQDALSVLGQFEANAKATSPDVSLGTFFSTGLAARNLAEGFRDKLRGSVTPPQSGTTAAGH
jgi:hypothetical protein